MNYEQFVCAMLECTKKRVSENELVEKQEILKNNGVRAVGIAIRKVGEDVAPIVHLDEYFQCFQAGHTLEELTEHLIARSRNAPKPPEWDYKAVLDFRKIKDRVVYKLINAEKNKKMLQEVPNLPIYDLAIVFYLNISVGGMENCSVLIRNAHMNLWKLPISVLYQCAKENTPKLCPYVIRPLKEYINVEEAEMKECSLLVLSNETGVNGAGAILYPGVPQMIYEYLGGNYYLLPSSIHEFVIVPEDENVWPENLVEMVREINATEIEKEEVLSDDIYYFNGNIITKI